MTPSARDGNRNASDWRDAFARRIPKLFCASLQLAGGLRVTSKRRLRCTRRVCRIGSSRALAKGFLVGFFISYWNCSEVRILSSRPLKRSGSNHHDVYEQVHDSYYFTGSVIEIELRDNRRMVAGAPSR